MMHLYLVQHGEAKSEAQDSARPLSEQGAEWVRRMAAWSANGHMEVDRICHSGKRRAAQTAELFEERLKPPGGALASAGMGPKDDVLATAEALNRERRSIMLVGHLPFLSRLVSQLLIGDPNKALVQFRNAGIVCLSRDGGEWVLNWTLLPELLPSRAE
jgi:phosphohistidine phosphatase